MEKLLNAMSDYCYREFEHGIEEIPEDRIIPLAYTTYDFDDGVEHEIQVSFDLDNLCYLNYIDGELVLTEKRASLDEVAEEISYCDFNDMIRDCVDKGYDIYGK